MNIFIIATVYHLKDVEHEKISVYFSRSPTDNGHHKFDVLLSIECWGGWSLNTCVVCVCMCVFIPKSRNRTHSALPRFPWISMSECLLLPRVLSMKFILLCMVIVHSFPIVLGYLCLFINSVFKFIHSATDFFFFFAHFPNVLGYLKLPCSKHSATDFSTYVDVNCVCVPIGGNAELPGVHLFSLLMEPVSQSFPKSYSLQQWTRLQIPVPLSIVYFIFFIFHIIYWT